MSAREVGAARNAHYTEDSEGIDMATPRKNRKSAEQHPATPASRPPAAAAEGSVSPARQHAPTHEDIEVRAYYLWRENSGESDPLGDWLTAERQMCDQYSTGGGSGSANEADTSPSAAAAPATHPA